MAYFEGEVPVVSTGTNNGMWGGDGIWAILLLALLGNGFGYGRGGYGAGAGISGEALGYELGKVATTNDVASGFSTSSIISGINDIKLGQSQMQNFVNQGFSGLSGQLTGEFRNVDNAICTLGYQTQAGFNSLAHQISDCCCATQRAIDGVNYNMAKNTCDIVTAINTSNQKVIDYMQNEKICGLQAENVALKGQISNYNQTNAIVSALKPTPVPSFSVPNPYCCYNTCGCTGVQ